MTRAPSQLMKLFLLVGCLAIATPAFAVKQGNNGAKKVNGDKNKSKISGNLNSTGKNGRNTQQVPEPGTLMLLGSGLIGLAVSAKRMQR